MTGKFVYKCRNCGRIYEYGTTSNYVTMKSNFIHLIVNGKTLDHMCPDLLESHLCNDTETTVTYLIALKKN